MPIKLEGRGRARGRPPGAASPSAKSIQEDVPLAVMAGRMKKFSEHTSTIPKVMDSSTLNFNPNFKFSKFFFFGWDPITPSGEC